jgi:hypothetical protein
MNQDGGSLIRKDSDAGWGALMPAFDCARGTVAATP